MDLLNTRKMDGICKLNYEGQFAGFGQCVVDVDSKVVQ